MLDIRDTDRIRIITLNRPEALNAFNEALYDATTEALMAAAADPTVAVVVITGAGQGLLGRHRRQGDGPAQRSAASSPGSTASPA